jgi:hypothetical protein
VKKRETIVLKEGGNEIDDDAKACAPDHLLLF